MITLYHGLASTCSKKVRLALYEKGLEFESRLVNLQAPGRKLAVVHRYQNVAAADDLGQGLSLRAGS